LILVVRNSPEENYSINLSIHDIFHIRFLGKTGENGYSKQREGKTEENKCGTQRER